MQMVRELKAVAVHGLADIDSWRTSAYQFQTQFGSHYQQTPHCMNTGSDCYIAAGEKEMQ